MLTNGAGIRDFVASVPFSSVAVYKTGILSNYPCFVKNSHCKIHQLAEDSGECCLYVVYARYKQRGRLGL